MIILRVALDVPLPKLFDYRSEDATRADIGYRVLVPFGKKRRVGLIWDVATKSKVTDSRLRSVEKILREVAPLPREWLALGEVCRRYHHPPRGSPPSPFPVPRTTTSLRRPEGMCSRQLRRVTGACARCWGCLHGVGYP